MLHVVNRACINLQLLDQLDIVGRTRYWLACRGCMCDAWLTVCTVRNAMSAVKWRGCSASTSSQSCPEARSSESRPSCFGSPSHRGTCSCHQRETRWVWELVRDVGASTGITPDAAVVCTVAGVGAGCDGDHAPHLGATQQAVHVASGCARLSVAVPVRGTPLPPPVCRHWGTYASHHVHGMNTLQMIAYNICFSTCLGRLEKVGVRFWWVGVPHSWAQR